MTRTIVGAAVLASVLGPAAAVTLEAQAIRGAINPTMDARCAAFPEGGRHRVWMPGPIVDPACEACTPLGRVPVPRNAIFDFTDRSRATCEWKDPGGGSLNLCQSDSVCAPGFTSITEDGVARCQGPEVDETIDCPAPPDPVTPSPAGPIPLPYPVPPACVQADEMEERLAQDATDLQEVVDEDASARGGPPKEAVSTPAVRLDIQRYRQAARALIVELEMLVTVSTSASASTDAELDAIVRNLEQDPGRQDDLTYRWEGARERADRALEILTREPGVELR